MAENGVIFTANMPTEEIFTLPDRNRALYNLADRCGIQEVRGMGLMLGVKTTATNSDVVTALRAEKLLSVVAGDNVVRILPPLIIEKQHVDEAIQKMEAAFTKLQSNPKAA